MPRKSSTFHLGSKRDAPPPKSSGYHSVQLQSGVSPESVNSVDQAVINRRKKRARTSKYLRVHPLDFHKPSPSPYNRKTQEPQNVLLRRIRSKLVKVDPPTVPGQATSSSSTPRVETPPEWREPTPMTSSQQRHQKLPSGSKPSVGDLKFNAELSAALNKRKESSESSISTPRVKTPPEWREPTHVTSSQQRHQKLPSGSKPSVGDLKLNAELSAALNKRKESSESSISTPRVEIPAERGQTTPMTSPQRNQQLTPRKPLQGRLNFNEELFAAVQSREARLPLSPHPSHASTTLSFMTSSTRCHSPSPLSSREPTTVIAMGSRRKLAPPAPPKRRESFLYSSSTRSTHVVPLKRGYNVSLEAPIPEKKEEKENTGKWTPLLHGQCFSSVADRIAKLSQPNSTRGHTINEIDEDEWEIIDPEQKAIDAAAKMTSSSRSCSSKSLMSWTADDVSAWLRSLQLDEYVANFSGVNGAQLAGLKEMGFVKLGMHKPSQIKLLKSKLDDVRYNT